MKQTGAHLITRILARRLNERQTKATILMYFPAPSITSLSGYHMLRRHIGPFLGNAVLLVALTVSAAGLTAHDEPITSRITTSNCLDGIFVAPGDDEAALMSAEADLSLVCGGGGPMGGARLGGPKISVPSSIGTMRGYGRPVGTKVKSVRETQITKWAKKYKVPLPCRTCATARRHATTRYDVYQLYWKDGAGKIHVYKYGITRNGRARPKSQLAKCNSFAGHRCVEKWIRTDVKGWRKARMVEAMHATKYKSAHPNHKCPPGMPRCL